MAPVAISDEFQASDRLSRANMELGDPGSMDQRSALLRYHLESGDPSVRH